MRSHVRFFNRANKSTSTSNPLTITFHRGSGKSMDERLCKKSRITSQPSQPAEKTVTIPGNVEKAVFIEPFCKENVNCINFINTDVYGQQKIKIVKNNTFEENDKTIMRLNLSVDVVNKDDVQVSSYKVLGSGSFGMVKKGSYKGTDVAVKTIRFTHNNKYILRELKIMDKLRHPNIISLMAVFVDYGEIGLVMEYFESNTLRSIINRKLNLGEIQKQQICLQISKAIAFLHSMIPPIFHKDIKPENILVNEYLVTKVCDMGLSRFEDMPESLKTTAGRTVGTVAYMAPEVLLYYESGNSAADVWALACVFVELYKEADVWSIPSNRLDLKESYKEIISTQKVPDLTSVPKSI
ncbi:hypothetical protein TSAR_006702 [Trichomalopsis sarcophagae]|uniref:Protein kinase domain-containing protein n=1 Tax=Trichomalopsis sarcophagae TaxID=543379 RepID=A0A232EJG9_9HYME|nr:hypothetical protein TSAR_006702 [Trichomalopsis sarcophagae]